MKSAQTLMVVLTIKCGDPVEGRAKCFGREREKEGCPREWLEHEFVMTVHGALLYVWL